MFNQHWNTWLSRVLPYWLTVVAVCWTLAYFYLWNAPLAVARYEATVTKVGFYFCKSSEKSVLVLPHRLADYANALIPTLFLDIYSS